MCNIDNPINCAIIAEWLLGVRYLEVKMYGGVPFGAKILSAVRNREASASRRLLMYYSSMVFSIRNTASVGCSVDVRFSEGPLREVPLLCMHDKTSLWNAVLLLHIQLTEEASAWRARK